MTVQISPPEYVQSPTERLWELSSNGDAFVWASSQTTIALSVHMAEICRSIHKVSGDLPSITALLFIIEALSRPFDAHETEFRLERLRRCGGEANEADLKQVLRWLQSLSEFDEDMRIGIPAQSFLLSEFVRPLPEHLFEANPVQAADAIEWLQVSSSDRDISIYHAQSTAPTKCLLAIQTLIHFANQEISEDSLRLERDIGVQNVPAPDDETVELPEAERSSPASQSYAELITKLLPDEELGQLARMAASAASTIALPRLPSDPDQLQIGGVSDITNRGQPERLLITELAADADQLLARIAHGEALYIRRETPPQIKVSRRRVVIECSVRTWGETRLRATAFAMAAAMSEERRRGAELTIISAGEILRWQEDLTNRDGIIAQLARLEPARHPGKSLKQLAESWNSSKEEYAPPLLILSRKTDEDPEFQRCMFEFPRPYLVAIIDQSGTVELRNRTTSGDETLHQQRMELPEIVVGPKPVSNTDAPHFVKMEVPPLRFSNDFNVRWAFIARDSSVWVQTSNRRLLCFDTAGVGAREIATISGDIVACDDTAGMRMVVSTPLKPMQVQRHLLVKISNEGIATFTPLQANVRGTRFCFDNGQLLRIDKNQVNILDESGQSIAHGSTVGLNHLGGPFFASDESLFAVSYENGAVVFYKLASPAFKPAIAFRYIGYPIFYNDSLSQTQVVGGASQSKSETGAKIRARGAPRLIMVHPSFLTAIVAFDHVFEFTEPKLRSHSLTHSQRWFKLDYTLVSAIEANYATAVNSLDNKAAKKVTSRSIRNRLNGIAARGDRILLFRKPSVCLEICLVSTPDRLVLKPLNGERSDGMSSFDNDISISGEFFESQWTLRKATLRRGDVWLDSRGLIHFRDERGEELTLVLHDEQMAGWHSNGTVFGTRYFTNREQDIPVPESVVNWLARFAIRCST